MQRKRIPIGLMLVLTLSISFFIITQDMLVFAAEPSKLKIYVGPSSVRADNSVYECVFVQLQDSSSRPARALEDTQISLSSSLTSVGTIEPTVTIPKGGTFAVAEFDSTFTPGSTTIAAAASGYATVQASLITVAPVPTKLAVYGFPHVVPADGISYGAIIVQLQDSSSNPAKAPLGGVTVTLFSSDETKATVADSVTIEGGQTHAQANITGISPGTTSITAMSSGYTSAQSTITTQTSLANPPKSLRVVSVPPKVMADNTQHQQIVIQLLDQEGKITQTPTTLPVQLSSSNENVGSIQPIVEVPAGKVLTTAMFSTTYRAGTTTITAAASNLQTDTETLTTIGPIPSKLAVYCNPSAVPADDQGYTAIQVQLQDSSGKPALDPNGEVTVSLFSSEPNAGTVQSTLTIPYGQTYTTATFKSLYITSSTSITAQASGYTTGQAQMKTYQIDEPALNITLTADPTNIVSGEKTNLTVYVKDPGQNTLAGATVKFSSSNAGTFTAVKAFENGSYTTVFTAPTSETETNIIITATVSKADFITSATSAQITVEPVLLSGTLQLCVKDIDTGEPIGNAAVAVIPRTAGMSNQTTSTNSTGYASFLKCVEGNYTLTVDKEGYFPLNTTLSFKVAAGLKTVWITSIDGDQVASNQTMTWLLPIVIVTAIAVAIVALVVVKQRRKRLQAL